MSEDGKAKIDVKVFRRLIAYAKPYKLYLFLAFFFTIGLAILSPLRPSVIGNMVDNYIVQGQDAEQLLFWTILVILMLFGEGIFQYANSYFSNLLAQSVIRDMRKKLFHHLIAFKMKFFDKTPIGSVVTRTVNDLEAISEVFSQGLVNVVGDILVLLTILGWMFYTNWLMTIFILIPIPILLIATRLFARAIKKGYQKERVEVNALNTFVQERLTGMAILQMFNREKIEQQRFEKINARHRDAQIHLIWANSIFFPFVEFLNSISIAFLLVFSAYSLSSGVLLEGETTGAIIKFTLWVQMMYRPIRQLADKFNTLQRGIIRAERVFATLDTKEQIQDEGTIETTDFGQAIHFDKVWMAYQDEKWVLKNVNLTIAPNTTVAFVGSTGAGKTSIVNLLSRFYEFQKGDIRIGNLPIRDIKLSYLRKNISIVLQDVFLFSNTIFNNITLGDENITREQVVEAAKKVGAHRFIMKLPGGYDYEVGERGGVLSVGQRQLLAFIRAYVYNPKILVLDEATSSVDNESERMIQEATEKLTVGRTSIVIAHRLSTIQRADKIVVMDNGEIVEEGSHQELLDKGGYYKNLFEKQFLGEDGKHGEV
jgi:ATP-binding cassette subfamily B multidrug efflux pump